MYYCSTRDVNLVQSRFSYAVSATSVSVSVKVSVKVSIVCARCLTGVSPLLSRPATVVASPLLFVARTSLGASIIAVEEITHAIAAS